MTDAAPAPAPAPTPPGGPAPEPGTPNPEPQTGAEAVEGAGPEAPGMEAFGLHDVALAGGTEEERDAVSIVHDAALLADVEPVRFRQAKAAVLAERDGWQTFEDFAASVTRHAAAAGIPQDAIDVLLGRIEEGVGALAHIGAVRRDPNGDLARALNDRRAPRHREASEQFDRWHRAAHDMYRR